MGAGRFPPNCFIPKCAWNLTDTQIVPRGTQMNECHGHPVPQVKTCLLEQNHGHTMLLGNTLILTLMI